MNEEQETIHIIENKKAEEELEYLNSDEETRKLASLREISISISEITGLSIEEIEKLD